MTTRSNLPRPSISWPLLPVPDESGALSYPKLADSVRDILQVILSTRSGEQMMHPTFGVGLTDFVGEPNTVATRRRIHDRVKAGIGRFEPRIDVDYIDVTAVEGEPEHVRIKLDYRLRRTGEARSMTVGLQLES